jgi:NADH-quinone oxidoreductase subunit E
MEEFIDLIKIDEIVNEYKRERGALIPILLKSQDIFGYLPSEVLDYIAKKLKVPRSNVYGVASFYAQFYRKRRGKNIIQICDGTACHVKRSTELIKTLKEELEISPGETTDDYKFTFDIVYCLGCCAVSPTVVINGQVQGNMTKEKLKNLVNFLK